MTTNWKRNRKRNERSTDERGERTKKKTYHQREGDGDGVDGFDQPQNDETGELDEREEVHAARLHLRKKTKQKQ